VNPQNNLVVFLIVIGFLYLRSPLPYPKYEVKGLRARLFYEGILEDTGYNGWVGSVLTLCDCIKIEQPLTIQIDYTPGQDPLTSYKLYCRTRVKTAGIWAAWGAWGFAYDSSPAPAIIVKNGGDTAVTKDGPDPNWPYRVAWSFGGEGINGTNYQGTYGGPWDVELEYYLVTASGNRESASINGGGRTITSIRSDGTIYSITYEENVDYTVSYSGDNIIITPLPINSGGRINDASTLVVYLL
jgi:hypothetical protein